MFARLRDLTPEQRYDIFRLGGIGVLAGIIAVLSEVQAIWTTQRPARPAPEQHPLAARTAPTESVELARQEVPINEA